MALATCGHSEPHPVGNVLEQLDGADLLGYLQRLGAFRDDTQSLPRIANLQRQASQRRYHAVTQCTEGRNGAGIDRHDDAEVEVIHGRTVRPQVAAYRTGDRRQHDVVHFAAEVVLDRLHFVLKTGRGRRGPVTSQATRWGGVLVNTPPAGACGRPQSLGDM